MAEFDRRDIVTINLKYGSSLKPLKTLAFAQLIAKALFLGDKPLAISDLSREVIRLIGIKNISEELIKQGLDYLKEINKVTIRNNEWSLNQEAKTEIAKELDSARFHIKGVLRRHFPSTIEEKKLKNWFKEASANFFGYYGDEWVSAISKKIDKKIFLKGKTIDELLQPSIKNHGLEGIKQLLIDGFVGFLSSEDNSDQQYLMVISQAMFSARLIAADVGADPITVQELRDAKFILDTNVLLSIALESSVMAKSVFSLEEALKYINASLIYLYMTKEEYGRALSGNKDQILNLVKIYQNEVLKDAANDFISTANARGCKSRDDYETFFRSLVEVPKNLPSGYKIEMEDDGEIEKIRKIAEEDKVLKDEIQKCALKVRARWRGPKSDRALNHDSTILHVAEFIKTEGKKCWVLSLDKSLHTCAVSHAGPHEIPILLSVSALIEILAINNAGPELDATNFAPLLSKIILSECMPLHNTYIIQDLLALHKINEKAAELPPEDVRELVKEVTKARIEGKTIDSTALQLKINRMYQESTMHITEKLADARKRAEVAEEALKIERQRIISDKITNVRIAARKKLTRKLVFGSVLTTIIAISVFLVYKWFFTGSVKNEIIGYVLGVTCYVIEAFRILPGAISDYRKECSEADRME